MARGRRQVKDKKWYTEVCIGVRKIVRIGKSKGIVIPKGFFDTNKLKENQECIVDLFYRDRSVSDEMTKQELIQFEAFKKYSAKEKKAMEKALKDLS